MSLDANVQSRWSAQILINASNPQNSTSTTIDTTRLTNAETDVQAAFKVMAGVAYDDTDDRHVLYAVEGVLVRLLVLTGQAQLETWTDWKKALKFELGKVTGRDRIAMSTRSKMRPTEEAPGAKPMADMSAFGKLKPNTPASNPSGSRDYLSDS